MSWAEQYHAAFEECACGKPLHHDEHPCVMCGERKHIYNLGRCQSCDTKFTPREEVRA